MLPPPQPKAKKTRKFAEMKRMISAKDARMYNLKSQLFVFDGYRYSIVISTCSKKNQEMAEKKRKEKEEGKVRHL